MVQPPPPPSPLLRPSQPGVALTLPLLRTTSLALALALAPTRSFARAEGGAPRGGEGGEGGESGASGGSGAGSTSDGGASSGGASGGESGAAAAADEPPPLLLASDEVPSPLLGARARELVRAAAAHEVRLAVTRSLLEGVAREAQRQREALSPREVSTRELALARLTSRARALHPLVR